MIDIGQDMSDAHLVCAHLVAHVCHLAETQLFLPQLLTHVPVSALPHHAEDAVGQVANVLKMLDTVRRRSPAVRTLCMSSEAGHSAVHGSCGTFCRSWSGRGRSLRVRADWSPSVGWYAGAAVPCRRWQLRAAAP